MIGSTIKVVVTAENGNVFESDETEEVGVYDELEILSAEQTAQYTAEVTFSAPISADDKLEVTKGGNKVEFKSAIDSDKLGAELTFTDALTDGEYTVTLTPADKDVDPSSVTFEGQKTVLYEIVFLSKELVMKDHYYNEGYAYIEGRDQWGKKKNLSGINVISGVGTFKSYDSDTGKITIKDDTVADDKTGAFLTIKEVPVFVQYQEGSTVISENETLTVSTRAYVDELSFGEIKKNSTETAKRLTLDELASGLYYVEILDAKDQYGNALSADDLQDQVEDKVLFVIPGDTGAFYTTGKFGELNGKTVLWLSDNNGDAKPGKMDLSITGAGGKTFTKEGIEIFDNPYIDTLTVDYPDLYEAMTESKKLNFSAIDQYVDDVNLWDFRPVSNSDGGTRNIGGTTLVFGDQNAMTTRRTEIKISGGALFNIVEYDTKAKEFKVTINVKGMKAKEMAVFTVTTAGTKVSTHTITIGEKGAAAKIASSFPSTKKLDPAATNSNLGWSKTWNINSDIAFTDVNGNAMTRNKNNKYYPYFVDGDLVFGQIETGDATADDDEIATTALANDAVIDKFVWTVSKQKITNAASAYAQLTAKGANQVGGFDDDGEVRVHEGTAEDFYITLFAVSGDKYYIVDSASTRVSGIEDSVEKKDIVAPGKLYAAKNSTDTEGFKVKLTNTVGESWNVDATSVVAGGIFAGLESDNTISGKIASDLPGGTTATTPVSVYYGGELIGTTDLTYTNVTPVPTTTKFKYYVQDPTTNDGTDANELGRSGKKYDKDLTDTEFQAVNGATYSVNAAGELTIEDANELGDTIKGWVVDQYDQPIAGTVVYLNGTKVTNGMDVLAKRNVWEFKNDNQGKAFYVTEGAGTTVSVKGTTTVNSQAGLAAAMADAGITEVHVAFGDAQKPAVLPDAITKNIVIDQGFVAQTEGTAAAATALSAGVDLTVSGTLVVKDNIESAVGDEVILEDGAVLDFGVGYTIDCLSVPGKSVVIDVDTAGNTIVKSFTVSGHAVITGGKLTTGNGVYTGTVVNITGTSIDIAKGASVELNKTSVTSVTSFNMGTNAGTVIVNNKAQLKAVIENTTAVGTIQIGTALADATTDTYNVTSTKGVTLDVNNTPVGGEIINDGKLTIKSSTAGGSVAKLTTTGTTVIGDGTNAVTVADLVSKEGAETTLSKAGVITALTGSAGGDLTVKAGSTIGGTSMTQDATVEDITTATTGTAIAESAEITSVGGTSTVTKGLNAATTNKALSDAVSAALTEAAGADVTAEITNATDVTSCKWAVFKNVKTDTAYVLVTEYDGKYYSAGTGTFSSGVIAWYEACDKDSVLMKAVKAAADGDLSKLTAVYLVEGSSFDTSDTAPTKYVASYTF